MAFIEVTKDSEKRLINTDHIDFIVSDGCGGTHLDLCGKYLAMADEDYDTVRLMIGRACGGITTAGRVSISEVE